MSAAPGSCWSWGRFCTGGRKRPCLPLRGRWHGEAVTEGVRPCAGFQPLPELAEQRTAFCDQQTMWSTMACAGGAPSVALRRQLPRRGSWGVMTCQSEAMQQPKPPSPRAAQAGFSCPCGAITFRWHGEAVTEGVRPCAGFRQLPESVEQRKSFRY